MAEALEFWTAAGVQVEAFDEGYAFLLVGGVDVAHLGWFPELDPTTNRAGCYVRVPDAEAWHQRWSTAGLPVTDVRVEPWGMREFRVIDPSGNTVRVGSNA